MAWLTRARNLFRSDRLSREIAAEMAAHLAERTDDLVAAGMSPEAAAAEARRRFGNLTGQREAVREADSFGWIESVTNDVRYGARVLLRSPGFTAVAIVSLALGVGANTAIFSLLNALALRSLPVQHAEQLVIVNMGEGAEEFTNPLWEQIRDQPHLFAGAAAYSRTQFNLTLGGAVDDVPGDWVSGSFFPMLGVRAVAGRLLQPVDDVRGCGALAAVSAGFASRRFGSPAAAVGQRLSIDGHPFEIVGVADPRFTGVEVGHTVDVYAPLCSQVITTGQPEILDERSRWYLSILARPTEGTTLAALRARLAVAAKSVFEATLPPEADAGLQEQYLGNTLSAVPAAGGASAFRDVYRQALIVLMVVSGAVLLIACANIANLLLSRAAGRQREMAIRLAVGAGRFRLLRQLLTESLLLSTGGVALGLLFAQWASRLLVQFLGSRDAAVWLDLSVDGRVLGFTVGLALLTGLLFGLAPAWQATRVDPHAAMKSGSQAVAGNGRHRLGKGLVAGQVALSLTLIAAAGLLLGSFHRLMTEKLGFERDGVVLVNLNFRAAGFAAGEMITHEIEALRGLRALAGVESASGSMITPISHEGWNGLILAPGYTPPAFRDSIAFLNQVSDGYFTTMRTRLLAGRDISTEDIAAARNVVVINAQMARRVFGGLNAIGRSFQVEGGRGVGPLYTVIGVVEDAKYREVSEAVPMTAFFPLGVGGGPGGSLSYEVRTTRSLPDLMRDVKSLAATISPAIPFKAVTLSEQIASTLTRPRLLAALSGFFGGLALLLAMIGLYGTIAYSVARRRAEIGIRMALGAGQLAVVRMVVGDAGRIVIAGLMLGLVLTLVLTRLLAAFLYGVTATDPATLIGSAVALAATALAAAWLPALAAARLAPTEAIRHD